MNTQKSDHYRKKLSLVLLFTCFSMPLSMLPASFVMAAENDLGEGAVYEEPESHAEDEPSGDAKENFFTTDQSDLSDQGRRQRVETRVKARMSKLYGTEEEHDESHTLTETDINTLRRQVSKGDSAAMMQLGYAYQEGSSKAGKDIAKAVQLFKAAGKAGEASAYSALGSIYKENNADGGIISGLQDAVNGGSVQKDDKTAVAYYQDGVIVGDPESFIGLGVMYRDGRGGLPKDSEKANFYYDKGLTLSNEVNKNFVSNLEKSTRAQAELDEGLRQPVLPKKPISKTTSISRYNCGLVQLPVPSSDYKGAFDAYCGGLSQEAKQDTAIPTEVKVESLRCLLQITQENTLGEDFKLYCK